VVTRHGSIHLVVVNEIHPRTVLGEFAHCYNVARPHRTLALETPQLVVRAIDGRIRSRPILGGYTALSNERHDLATEFPAPTEERRGGLPDRSGRRIRPRRGLCEMP